jgi:putative membrane protein
MLVRLLWHWLVLFVGLYIVTCVTPISYDHPSDLGWAALVLIVANTFVRPVLIFFTLPLVLISLGFFILIINALILYALPHFVPGFHVPGFWSAFFGALLLSIITAIFGGMDRRATIRRVDMRPPAGSGSGSGKVIDI